MGTGSCSGEGRLGVVLGSWQVKVVQMEGPLGAGLGPVSQLHRLLSGLSHLRRLGFRSALQGSGVSVRHSVMLL